MPRWDRVLAAVAREAAAIGGSTARGVVAAPGRLKSRMLGRDRISIVPYRGFGTPARVHLSGRVLEDEEIPEARPGDRWWRNLASSIKRLESDEVPGARLRIRFAGGEWELVTNREGYFHATLEPLGVLEEDRIWHEAELELLAPPGNHSSGVRVAGQLLVPLPRATMGVISDIDDTVIRTDATSLIRMARGVLLGNARTRLPFPGVAGFYRALHGGPDGDADNPVFYVSSSPWNLYDLLVEFFQWQEIPAGPLMLRDWGFRRGGTLPFRHGEHKLTAIRRILETYPGLPFLLIGDSGQEDPEIYRAVVHEYPDRIPAIYIRNVKPHPRRSARIRALAKEVLDTGATLILADDTLAAAEHAAAHGWIAPEALVEVREDKAEDEPPAGEHGAAAGVPPESTGAPTVVIEGGRDVSTARRRAPRSAP